jgi:putative membrane protein insertion efficiency factor
LKTITERSSHGAHAGGDNVSLSARALLALLRGYKILISPYFRGSCRFLPSCADYAAIAVERHGAIRGSWLAARRLARCHPLCTAGHDPVPQ